MTMAPPSPHAPRFYVGKKLKQPRVAPAARGAPVATPRAPRACAASSTTRRCSRAAEPEELGHRRAPAEEVHREHGPHAQVGPACPRDGLRARGRREVHRRRVDVAEDRSRPDVRDRLGRRDEGDRRRHDRVARPDAEAAQRELEGVGPRGHRDGVLDATRRGEPALERLDARAEHEPALASDRRDGGQDLVGHLRLLGGKIDERDRADGASGAAHHLRCRSAGSAVRTRSW